MLYFINNYKYITYKYINKSKITLHSFGQISTPMALTCVAQLVFPWGVLAAPESDPTECNSWKHN